MIRPRLMEQVERAAKLYDREVEYREMGRRRELNPVDFTGEADDFFAEANKCREQRLWLLRRAGLL